MRPTVIENSGQRCVLSRYGEGWHNNHHAFQTSARHGLRLWEVDMTYVATRMLSAVGLAHSVTLPKLTRETPLPSGGELAEAIARHSPARLHSGVY